MLRFLPGWVSGLVMMLLLIVNTLFWATPLLIFAVLKLLSPVRGLRDLFSRAAAASGQHWASVNTVLGDVLLPTQWEIRGVDKLNMKGQYLVSSNHQSWNDIYVLMKAFDRRAPFFKFFIKQELIWVPVLGLCWWALDYPFMKRYSSKYLAKHPELRGKDFETTKKACARYATIPVTILNFLEGTRFTQAKHDDTKSPYTHLLKPKAGGFALTIGALGENINSLLDVTIVYPGGALGFWDFLCGRVRRVIVEVRQITIPHEMYGGDYEGDKVFRKHIQNWIADLWAEKDARMAVLLAGAPAA
ncbi:acyltransferase [Nevskia sp.]|uniref:acyltransferase n=1 Tax=Nevskia sp. TaxID=1929292 RepID=UPI0025CFA923|nr:acyltransferase [Nevskia sp.]